MRIAIVHYHFQRGGVRTVVENACSSLAERDYQFAVLSGEALVEDGAATSGKLPQSGAPYRVLPELAYGQLESPGLLERAKALVTQVLGGPPDLWHIHNHCLGKNLTVPQLARELAAEGAPLLLQIHDFAEDGRPDNYRFLQKALGVAGPEGMGRALYPSGGRVHYAALNGRDAGFLKAAGAPSERVHCLPNAVHLGAETGSTPQGWQGRPLILYPTRAIRRKNIGEFLLTSRLGPNAVYAVTMAPGNPLERPIYERWVALARELELPVEWEFGTRSGLSFPALMSAAERIYTSSVGEGFGLAFLEPWLAGRPVAGRDLPDITADFREAGVQLPGLYGELRVPLGADADAFRAAYQDSLAQAFAAYGKSLSQAELDAAWEEASADGKIDFGKLNEAGQERVIRAPGDIELQLPEVDEGLVAENRRVIAETYSPTAYGQRLDALYKKVTGEMPLAGVEEKMSGARLLECFLAPSRFTPLRGVR